MTVVDPSVAPVSELTTGRTRRPLPDRLRGAGPVLLAMLVAGVLHLVWWRFIASGGGDIAAQDAWAEFALAHPGSAYNLAWYGGMHPVSYSVISPYLMAVVGVRPTMVIAGTLSAGLLAWLVVKREPTARHRAWPAVYGAVALFGDAVSGRVTFALGTLFALAAFCLVFAWPATLTGPRWRRVRGVLTATLAALATASSPVAGLFLGLVAAALWLDRRRAASLAVGLTPVAVVGLSALLFPFSGKEPMSWDSAILPVIVALTVWALVPLRWRVIRVTALVYVVAVLLAWLVPSPVGTNVSRLGLLFGGVVLVAAAVSGEAATSFLGQRVSRRSTSVLLVMAILTATIWQVATATLDDVHSRLPSTWSGDLSPLLSQLEERGVDTGRIEVVPTRSHQEAAALAPHVNLARGWNRQADAERNPIFYLPGALTADSYRHWLHRWAVSYVVLPSATPDPSGGLDESVLVGAGLPYLREVWSDPDWRLLEVTNPTPLVSAPATVLDFDADEVTISTPKAGHFVIRVASSPWLSLVDAEGNHLDRPGCLTDLETEKPRLADRPGATNWLVLHAPKPGVYRIGAPYRVPRGSACPSS